MLLLARTRGAKGELLVKVGDHIYWAEDKEFIYGEIVELDFKVEGDKAGMMAKIALCDEAGNFTEESVLRFV